jgi:hypothetical protein
VVPTVSGLIIAAYKDAAYGACGLSPAEFYACTPTEVRDKAEAVNRYHKRCVLEQDEISAKGIHMDMLIARNNEWKREYGYTYPHVDETPVEEVVEDNSSTVNVFKQWVTATGGRTV